MGALRGDDMSIEPALTVVERKVRDLVLEHVRRVCEAVRNMVLTIESYLAGDSRGVTLYLARTRQMEGEADDYRRNVYEFLARTSPALLNREDWVRLSIDLDKVADLAYSVAYRVSIACEKGWSPPREVASKLGEMAEAGLQLCEKLKEALFTYAYNAERARIENMSDLILDAVQDLRLIAFHRAT
ncbi:hypothetical protein B6U99_03545 [Candidatus Geothermarchaeota archaeon ex4572_27]|nr:MAG: hypothetical protein B6U99_03545 [Candidatus Geothermarchaeota archaeon ex4572_27]